MAGRYTIVANWKMNPASWTEAKKLFVATKKAADAAPSVSLIVAPPALYLRELRASYRGRGLSFAAQSAHWDLKGPYTGEISMAQVKDAGATSILVGHSERRAAGETNDQVRQKVAQALHLKLSPIVCVGELRRAATGEHFAFVKEQLRAGLSEVAPTAIAKILIAYEPVWAIGGEQTMSPRDMHEMSIFIRKSVVEMHGERGHMVKILYGGAATETNAAVMLTEGDVSGLLVGHVSVDPKRFAALIAAVHEL